MKYGRVTFSPPRLKRYRKSVPDYEPNFDIDEKRVAMGESHWTKSCLWCHGPAGVAGGGAPDLRASPVVLDLGAMKKVLVNGAREL